MVAEQMADCVEVGGLVRFEVVSHWDTSQALDKIMETEGVAALRTMVAESLSPFETMKIRLRIGQLMMDEFGRRKEEMALLSVSSLSQWAVHCQVHPPTDYDTVMSATFLVSRESEGDFVDHLRELASRLDREQQLRLVWTNCGETMDPPSAVPSRVNAPRRPGEQAVPGGCREVDLDP